MREIRTHLIEGASGQIVAIAHDEPGHGGANHRYSINACDEAMAHMPLFCALKFQEGPIAEVGVNGITHEVLIAILIDRLEGFQKGKFACGHNHLAINYLRSALMHLKTRTLERMRRGVEGKSIE